MDNNIIGYVAATTSVLAFGTQFVHTIRSGTTAGLSFPRTILDSVSLLLWVVYATRIEDLPLLIATSFEFVTSLCVCVLIIRNRYNVWLFVKLNTPDTTPSPTPAISPSESIAIDVSLDSSIRRDSVSSVHRIERRNSI
jgi:hypothetical protein